MPDKPNDTEKPATRRTLSGLARLSTDAINGLTNLVEALHQTILSGGSGNHTRTRGVTGMVYQNIRDITDLAGDGLDALLPAVDDLFAGDGASTEQEAFVAALNGVLGDHLAAKANPLAIPMQLRSAGKAIDPKNLPSLLQQSDGKLAILVHGLCMNDLQWSRKGHDHGECLARKLGLNSLYLHYNTGLHISQNGRRFAEMLDSLLAPLAQPVSLILIGHSMGGLVARSACYYAQEQDHQWLPRLQKLICLGAPHHGALLEKGGNMVDALLEISAYSAPFARLGKIRSSGITDLRYGNVIDADWQDHDRFAPSGDPRRSVPLPEGVSCYAMAAVTGKTDSKMIEGIIGDGLVPVESALGRHKNPALDLHFPQQNQWLCQETGHLDLLSSQMAYEQLEQWLRD